MQVDVRGFEGSGSGDPGPPRMGPPKRRFKAKHLKEGYHFPLHDAHVVAACLFYRFFAVIQELLRESYARQVPYKESDHRAVQGTGWRREENPRRRRSRRQELAKFIFLESHITHDVRNAAYRGRDTPKCPCPNRD